MSGPDASLPFGVVCGLKSEARCLPASDRLVLGISGARPDKAEAEAQRLVSEGVSALISFGLAGGVSPDLAPGDFLLPRTVMTEDGRAFATDGGLLSQASGIGVPATGPLLGVDRLITGAAEKAELHRATKAMAIDMESHRVAMVAERAGLPFCVIRAVADPHDRSLPPSAGNAVAEDGSIRVLTTIGNILRRPGDLGPLMALQKDSAAASRTLRAAGIWLAAMQLPAAATG